MLKEIELVGFKSFGKKTKMEFDSNITAIVGPNGSGKSNVAEAFRFVLGEQSMKSMRSKSREDLIWGGSPSVPRTNRAGVKVVFDNSKRLLDIDFSEVVVERVVYRDGQNEYLLNGSKVRLKDVVRLLAGANIGGSGYQIISQGESDRILNATPRERREMIEDALGLKLYQHKKIESERKLSETEENIEKIKSLRRELAPHLKFLGRQVEKVERAKELKEDLRVKLTDYLARENAWIINSKTQVKDEMSVAMEDLRKIDIELNDAMQRDSVKDSNQDGSEHENKIHDLEKRLMDLRLRRDSLTRDLGRAEAKLEMSKKEGTVNIEIEKVRAFAESVRTAVDSARNALTLEDAKMHLDRVKDGIREFLYGISDGKSENADIGADVARISEDLLSVQKQEKSVEDEISSIRILIKESIQKKHKSERETLVLQGKKKEIEAKLRMQEKTLADLRVSEEQFEEEVREGIALIGSGVHGWDNGVIPEGALSEPRSNQEKRRRDIERIKIKIEESGVGKADEIIREFNNTKKRDEFLCRELEDLSQSANSIRDIIEELDQKIDESFKSGLEKINKAFQVFFIKLFGGGMVKLYLEKSENAKYTIADEGENEIALEEVETPVRGLAINVQLPRKKISGLGVLSGGERALTSIALIFAMSQVNPPPFLILDETDAALDEANSKRYADVVSILGEKSQVILITHNRATMAAAGELYGITMGSDTISKLLSVKLEEAEKVAK